MVGNLRYPFSEPHALDIDPLFERLRDNQPVVRVTLPYGGDAWLVLRHADVRAVLTDSRFSRAAEVGRDAPRMRPEINEQSEAILNMDPPEHTRLRRLVAKAFTARRVEALRPRTAELTAHMLSEMRHAGQGADLVKHLAMPLPVTVICELMGVPHADRYIFRDGADALLSLSSMSPAERAQARDKMVAYLGRLAQERRRAPSDDLLGALVIARDEGDRLTEKELIFLAMSILVGGHETTMNQIGNFVFALLTMPDHGAAFRADPTAIARGVEELLRFIPLAGASVGFPRIATEEIELSGVKIGAGESVVLPLHAANRDPEVFEDADELVLDRELNHHVAFGHGIHHCLGAHLARMELQETVGGLFREFPGLRLAVPPSSIAWRKGFQVRGPRALPLAW